MEDLYSSSHNKDPYPWMKKVYIVPGNFIEQIKTDEDITKIGKKLSGNELEKFKQNYFKIEVQALKKQVKYALFRDG